ncbi:pentapeptide repeat-containing protein [Maribacter polysiphoniae]|uniref:Pentapeptide repeat protein n=1 Tax=Maribacter polysiphoniae TaxID=429344 RepID=A0A316E7C8_9FLAO|nr:pentapeptide repeat-containing protein [Maribacter polysiphoniae]MBD1259815.1 pentapeptide repeat-containing protein [Maribacter polysiphoniae]PWK25269.1 pentapeptide repeat protein [Maribacter polysiphoniae]
MVEINDTREIISFLQGNYFGTDEIFTGLPDREITIEVQYPFENPLFPEKNSKKVNISFTNCTFQEQLKLEDSDSFLNFENCKFYGRIEGGGAHFSGKIRFRNCHFYKEVRFKNTRFNDLADFYSCHFYQRTIFYKTDFMQTCVFSGVTFHENVLFTYTLVNKLIIFRGTNFRKGLDLSLSILSGSLSVFDIQLNDFEVFSNKLTTDQYEEIVFIVGEIPIKNKRETFRILRKIFEGNSDYINSLDYKKLELKTYDKILDHNISISENKWASRFNKIVLWLNKNSNDYGTRFEYGVLFTFVVGLLFYFFSFVNLENIYITLIPSNWSTEVFDKFWTNYLKFLNPAHSVEYLGQQQNFLFYFFDYLGRIFVGYGIYQTIQAFRKYK